MNKREARRWIKQRVAHEMRIKLSEVPDYVNDAPDPAAVEAIWQETVWDIAERLAPEVELPR